MKPKPTKPAPDWIAESDLLDEFYKFELKYRERLPEEAKRESRSIDCMAWCLTQLALAVRADAKRKFLKEERERWLRYLSSNDEAAYSDPHRATITMATLDNMYPPRRVGGREGEA